MFMPLDRLQLKICAISGKFNVCSKRLFLSWIKICRDFTLQTQIFTQKYRSWLRFYSEFLRKKLAAEVSAGQTGQFLHCFYRTRVRSLGMLVTNSLTDWLTNCCLVNLIDVTLACEDANSKLVVVVTVAEVDAEDHVGNSLLQIWELTFGPTAKLLFRLWAQGWSRFWSWSSSKILKLEFVHHFAADVL